MHLLENKLSSDVTLIFRALPGLYLLMRPDFVIQDMTTLYASSVNLSIEDVTGKSIFDVFPEDGGTVNNVAKLELSASLHYVVTRKEAHTISFTRFNTPLSAGGFEERFWKITNTPILDSTGELLYILNEAKDITEKIQQEQLHLQNQERLAMLNNAVHTVGWEYDIMNDRLSWDQRLHQVFGYMPEEMEPSGSSWDKLVHPDDFSTIQQSIARATSQGQKIWTGEYRFKKADGTYAHVLDQGYFVYDKSNRPLRTFGTIIDLSQNKRAEEELKESDARFRQLLENLPHMAWTADSKGKILYFNNNWYDFTGMTKGHTDGWASVIHPEDAADVLTNWHEAISTGKMFEIEFRIRDGIDGSYRYFMERGVPMHDQDGNIKLWVGTFTDIQDQKQQRLDIVRLNDQQLQSILQLSPAHLCLLEGPNHVCRYVSPGIYRMFGSREYAGTPAKEVWTEPEYMSLHSMLNQVYTQGEPAKQSEIKIMYDRYQKGSFQEAFFNFRYQPLLNAQGQIEGILMSAVEVTELVQAKNKAEKLAAELKQHVE